MTTARRKQVCLDVTPIYHCVTRCVRRSFLCGYDKLTRINYNHRRAWIEDRLLFLTEVFCIKIAGYAILSNHYHVILNVNKEFADNISDEEVIARWLKIYRGPQLVQRYNLGERLTESEHFELQTIVDQWRDNLSNISRFMGNLNEYIARKANKEDDCKGVFWESRFKSQAVLDVPALLQTLCYVDLNPVRANIAKTPEESKYTSVRRRLHHRKTSLMKFCIDKAEDSATVLTGINRIPISFKNYLQLLDWTGRQLRQGKRGTIDHNAPPIMTRLGFSPEKWLKTQTPQVSWRQKALGSAEKIKEYCTAIDQRWIWQQT